MKTTNNTETWEKITKDNINTFLYKGQQLRYKIGNVLYGYKTDDKRYYDGGVNIVDKNGNIICSNIFNNSIVYEGFDYIEALSDTSETFKITHEDIEDTEEILEVVIQPICYNNDDMYYAWYIPSLGIRSSYEYTRSDSAKRSAKKICEKLNLSYFIK